MSHPADAPTHILNSVVRDYLDSLRPADDPLLAKMERYGETRGFPLVGRESGHWLELLTRLTGGARVFEAGSGYGYSAFFFARAVGPTGEVVCTEKDKWEQEAFERLYQDHPFRSRIDFRCADAIEVLSQTSEPFDVAFIDVEKRDYVRLLEALVPKLRIGGLLLADNTLWGGKVAAEAPPEDLSTLGVQAFNRRLFEDSRLQSAILPACDGLSVSLRVS
jgi:predicted O-methyltransferase YrrM